jgi:hypothetical protein
VVDRFPWQTRRYLFLRCTSWNELLSVSGSALAAMKKLGVVVSGGGGGSGESAEIVEDVVTQVDRLLQFNRTFEERGSGDGSGREPGAERLSGEGGELYDFNAVTTSTPPAGDADLGVRKVATPNSATVYGDSVEVTAEGDGAAVEVTSGNSLASAAEPATLDMSSHSRKQPSSDGGRAGGVKNALNRLFNRGSTTVDPYARERAMRAAREVSAEKVRECEKELLMRASAGKVLPMRASAGKVLPMRAIAEKVLLLPARSKKVLLLPARSNEVLLLPARSKKVLLLPAHSLK